ncbi:hypothetical protein [Aureitalea marina]|uniref:Outer membrane protein beta-barrel domain-containing protein n=1 Tax=Aureitalea marina TaxID=930804 RepID=A0A2S7KPZ6_9FLAO|nr:hypothetical protein [Aureitalea marina]PQB04677.1 hypothetical protein BST85_07045 [Aureitalea marina]
MTKKISLCAGLIIVLLFYGNAFSQVQDSTETRGEYPYVLPILGKKAYAKGYNLPLPFSASIGTIFNKQGIILEDFSMAFTQGNEEPDFDRLQPISDLIVFGPSEGRINTLFARVEAWVLPFLSVGGYFGKVWGEQTVTLTAPIEISSVTDIDGQYYGLNLVGVVPIGPVVLQADYSWAWTTNDRLDKPVLVNVAGARVIKRFVNKTNPERFWGVWAGAQSQKLDSETSGNIPLGEALGLDETALNDLDQRWETYTMSPEFTELPRFRQELIRRAYEEIIRPGLEGLAGTTVYYKFKKRLEFEWNMLIGGTYQFNRHWAARVEYGFLQSKQQLTFIATYNFGL